MDITKKGLLNANEYYIRQQMKDLRKGYAVYIYFPSRKRELDQEIKTCKMKVEIDIVYKPKSNKIDYWIYKNKRA